jgi:hypothetical protein
MRSFVLLIVFASVIQTFYGLFDDSLIEKDLYKHLGIKSNASLHDIKKAFRGLAQLYHPDKSKPNNKVTNEALFREVATAYEVLSDSSQREEYDSMRSMRERRNQQSPNRRNSQGNERHAPERQQQQHHNEDYSTFFSFDDWEDYEEEINTSSFFGNQPVIAGPMLPAMQVIFPYTPIIVSEDQSHFCFLDMHCSFGVYKGDLNELIRHLLVGNEPPDLTIMPLELKFRTEGEPTLNGQCFAGLDESGVLRVYRGHPDYPGSLHPIWSSDPPKEDASMYNSYFRSFYVELSSKGYMIGLRFDVRVKIKVKIIGWR